MRLYRGSFVSKNAFHAFQLGMPRGLSDVLFNIALNAFRHATLGCLFRSSSSDTRATGRFMDVVLYDLKIGSTKEQLFSPLSPLKTLRIWKHGFAL